MDVGRWIKVESSIIFTTNPKATTENFFDVFVAPYYEKQPVYLNLKDFEKHKTIEFVEIIRKMSENSRNIIFIHKP